MVENDVDTPTRGDTFNLFGKILFAVIDDMVGTFYTQVMFADYELRAHRLVEQGHVVTRSIPRPYDPVKNMFLPDRYIRGTCPRCKSTDQYGDSCEVCGSTYAPSELLDPVSVISGVAPVERESEQYFVKLGDFEAVLKAWIRGEHRAASYTGVCADALPPSVQPEIANKLAEWFDAGLQDWDISRNAPYFGFEIPDAPGKYFYVWLDAPIGYMASFKHLCTERAGLDFDTYWAKDSNAELYHFIGKDIAYFHTLFWPAQLYGAGFRTPTAVFCHGSMRLAAMQRDWIMPFKVIR